MDYFNHFNTRHVSENLPLNTSFGISAPDSDRKEPTCPVYIKHKVPVVVNSPLYLWETNS